MNKMMYMFALAALVGFAGCDKCCYKKDHKEVKSKLNKNEKKMKKQDRNNQKMCTKCHCTMNMCTCNK